MTWDEIENIIDELGTYGKYVDSKIKRKLMVIIASMDSENGNISPQELQSKFAQLDKEMRAILGSSQHKEISSKMFGLVDNIVSANVDIYKDLKLTRQGIQSSSNIDLFQEQIELKFSDVGYRENVLIPIKKIINEAVISGKGTTTLINEFNDLFDLEKTTSGRSMSSYIKQVTNDVVNSTNGQIQLALRDKYDLKKMRYVGSLKDNSRPICAHIVNLKQPILLSEVETILKEYRGSNKIVQNEAGKSVKKGSGILSNATLDTFIAGTATPNCRHRRLMVR